MRIAAQASVWFGCVLRAELAPIIVGVGTSIQYLTMVHAGAQQPCVLGVAVTTGHRAVIHGATIEDGALVGIGGIVLSGATVGEGTLIGAGSVVAERVIAPARHLALGFLRVLCGSQAAQKWSADRPSLPRTSRTPGHSRSKVA